MKVLALFGKAESKAMDQLVEMIWQAE